MSLDCLELMFHFIWTHFKNPFALHGNSFEQQQLIALLVEKSSQATYIDQSASHLVVLSVAPMASSSSFQLFFMSCGICEGIGKIEAKKNRKIGHEPSQFSGFFFLLTIQTLGRWLYWTSRDHLHRFCGTENSMELYGETKTLDCEFPYSFKVLWNL